MLQRETQKQQRLGQTLNNKFGSKMTIKKYNNSRDIIVEFENGYNVNTKIL
jgi:hypothetical protein